MSILLPSRAYYRAKPAVLICIVDSHANEVLNEDVAQTLYTTMQVMVYNRVRNLDLFVCFFVYRVCPHVCCMYFLCMWAAQLDNLHLLHSLTSSLLVCLFKTRSFWSSLLGQSAPGIVLSQPASTGLQTSATAFLLWRCMLGIQTQALVLGRQPVNVFAQSVS